MSVKPVTTITGAANQALDVAFKKTAGPLLLQVVQLTQSKNSELQRALARLDEEANRLDADEKKMTADNPVLLETLRVVEHTFKATASLIKANDNKIEASGQALAVPAVTAKVFLKLSGQLIAQHTDPVSPQAMAFYRKHIAASGAKWRMPK